MSCCAVWVSPLGPPTVEEAIETIRHAQDIHRARIRPEHEGHDHGCAECWAAGNPDHHRGVIARYERVLEVLRGSKP